MLGKLIEAAVEKAVGRRTARPDKKLTLEGYLPLPEIMGEMYSWLFAPFNGAEILVEVRHLRSTQLPDVDKLWAIAGEGQKDKTYTRQQAIDVMNIQEECCRAVLNRPTFEEIEKAVYGKDNVLKARRKELGELREKLKGASGAAKAELQRETDRLEMFTGFILPDDTMLALTNIALGIGVSDIDKMTKEKLVAAHAKARLYGGRPSDFVPGLFTDGDRQNIDNYAAMLGTEAERGKNGGK
jgi:hypothetical protein